MKYVNPLSPQDKKALTRVYQTHTNHRVRQRSHAILLSNRGYKIPDISRLLESHRDRVSAWVERLASRRHHTGSVREESSDGWYHLIVRQ